MTRPLSETLLCWFAPPETAEPQPRGASITYAEVDGVRVCITDRGDWCERDHGHDGPHVLQPARSDHGGP